MEDGEKFGALNLQLTLLMIVQFRINKYKYKVVLTLLKINYCSLPRNRRLGLAEKHDRKLGFASFSITRFSQPSSSIAR